MGYIYKIENRVNHMMYIGLTSTTIKNRWRQHIGECKKNNNRALYVDMRKYGIENFSVSEVEYVKNNDDLPERERYWIKYYDTYNNGYNNSSGGEYNCGGYSESDRKEIWNLWKSGKKIKEISEIFRCNDATVRFVLDIHGVSTEERLARSYDDQLNSNKPYQREVEQIDVNTNKVIATYPSVSDAARSVKIDESHLSKVCRRGGVAKGFRWRYTNNDYIKKDFSPRKVGKINLKTKEIIEVFPSLTEAAKAVGGDTSYLSKVCRGIQKSSKGFGWKFLDV